jgi:chemosensory pili system protein ChpC
MNAVIERVRSVWVPLHAMTVLVPNASVAEVLDHQTVERIDNGPQWLLGAVRWRDLRIPAVSMELLLGGDYRCAAGSAKIMVFNSARAQTTVPFLAVPISGIPSLFTADAEGLGESLTGESELARTIACCIRSGEKQAYIPDLSAIQGIVEDAWQDTAE